MFTVNRSKNNPILSPTNENDFENFAAFNPSPVLVGKNTYIVYRAQTTPERFENGNLSLSTIGIAKSVDGEIFTKREQFIYPEYVWERFGLEDPRVTKINGKYFIFYTALSVYPFSGDGIKVALAISEDMKTIKEKHLITPFNAKAMTLFPEKINGKYVAILAVDTDRPPSKIAIAEFSRVEEMWDLKYWKKWYSELHKHILDISKIDNADQLEVGATPVKTKEGWLLVYSHINNYYSSDKIFGVRAVLLDLKNPKKIIGNTRGALLVPEEKYEFDGQAPNIVFPSGAIIKKDKLFIYYGAADTTCAVASVNLQRLLVSMKEPHIEDGFQRIAEIPLLVSRREVKWESKAIFNPAAIKINSTTYIIYRAMSEDNTSVLGLAASKDGFGIYYRSDNPIYIPREYFEEKRVPNGNSGCEDPRLTKIGDTIYMCYTAYNGVAPPSVALTSIKENDLKEMKWKWKKPVLVTADGVDDKDGCLHPEKVNGKYFLFHRVNNRICGDYSKTTEFKERNNFENITILSPRKGMWDEVKVGISVPPIKTKKGWLLLYHGVSKRSRYRVGVALLDLKDPTKVLARSTDALFEPLHAYETAGQVNYVVFPCGAVLNGDDIYMYYGGGDSVVSVAKASLSSILESLV